MIQSFQFKGLKIQSRRFGAVEPRATASTGEGRVVSVEVLEATRTPGCRCEDPVHMASLGHHPLHVGTPLRGPGGLHGISPEWDYTNEQWVRIEGGEGLGSGCTAGHVCPRLDKVRKAYNI